jgi:hypothetical protein
MSQAIVAVVSMMIVVMMAWGLYSTRFEDNFLQWLGMWGVLVYSLSVFWPETASIVEFGFWNAVRFALANVHGPEGIGLLGILLFSLGHAWKVFKHRSKSTKPPDNGNTIDQQWLRHVRGGMKD